MLPRGADVCDRSVQGNALPSPLGFAQVLLQYNANEPVYVGCMKSGPVVTDWKSPWYEPSNFKFGSSTSGDRNYMLHASANGYAISRPVALHIARFSDILAVRPWIPPAPHSHPIQTSYSEVWR